MVGQRNGSVALGQRKDTPTTPRVQNGSARSQIATSDSPSSLSFTLQVRKPAILPKRLPSPSAGILDPKGIRTRNIPKVLVLPPRSLDLRSPILRKIHALVLGQESSRMPDIPDNHVHQHEGRFKDVEEPFVANGRAERHWVEGWAEQRAQRRSGEVLPNAVGGPREEEQHACVEAEKGALEFRGEDAPSGTAAVENTNDEKK